MTMIDKIRAEIALRADDAEKIRTATLRALQPADDLSAVKGIGPAVAKALAGAGMKYFDDLAAATDEALDAIKKGTAKKAATGDWRAQAAALAEAKPAGEAPEKLPFGARVTAYDLWSALDLDTSEIDLSKRLMARFDGRLCYVKSMGALAWTGARWKLEEMDEAPLARAAQETVESLRWAAEIVKLAHAHGLLEGQFVVSKSKAREIRKEDPEAVVHCYEEHVGWAKACKSKKAMSNAADIASNHIAQDTSKLDTHRHLLPVKNGTIDLRTGEILRANPGDLMTKMAPITVPTMIDEVDGKTYVRYQPEKAATWLKAINQAFLGDAELVDYIRRWVGYLITGENTEQQFFIAFGGGSNMKGVFMRTLKNIIPEHFTEIEKDFLMKTRERKQLGGTNEALADLRGARVIHAEEGDPDDVLDEGPMKRISGGGDLKAAKKFKSEITFNPQGKIVYETNPLPRINSQIPAIWRRVTPIPFQAHFANPTDPGYQPGVSLPKDEHLEAKLANELPHILAWAVMGAVDWYRLGLRKHKTEPAVIDEARRVYRDQTDILGDFLGTCIDRDPEVHSLQGQLYEAYSQFCELNATGNPVGKKTFGTMLEERGFDGDTRAGNRVRLGLKLNKVGWLYQEGKRPSKVLGVIDGTGFKYRLAGVENSADRLADLPEDLRAIVAEAGGGRLPKVGLKLHTNRGVFERTA